MNKSKIVNKKYFMPAVLLLAAFVAHSCYKPPTFPDTPAITFQGYDIDGIYAPGSTGNILLGFTDGDGDLGKVSNDDTVNVKNVVIKNLKYSYLIDSLNLPLIPQKGTDKAISGTIEVKLKSLIDEADCLLLQKPTDTLTFEIKILDRAGHVSNIVTTSSIVVQCP